MQKTVLVLGANGKFGGHATEAFWNAGWTVRLFERGRDSLMQAAQGADIIVAAWNPPYHLWETQLPILHRQIQDAARAAGAMVLLPSNVYVYGFDTPQPWTDDTPHRATNPLGRVRIAIEQSYRDSGVQTVMLRAGDFIDTKNSGGWFDKVLASRLSKGDLVYPGDVTALHSWAFLPDLARAAEHLAQQKGMLGVVEEVLFPGITLSAAEMATHLSDILNTPIRTRKMSWLPLRVARPFWPMAQGLLEMRYLWDLPHCLQSTRLQELCPDYRDTPVEDVLERAVASVSTKTSCPCRRLQSITTSTQTSL